MTWGTNTVCTVSDDVEEDRMPSCQYSQYFSDHFPQEETQRQRPSAGYLPKTDEKANYLSSVSHDRCSLENQNVTKENYFLGETTSTESADFRVLQRCFNYLKIDSEDSENAVKQTRTGISAERVPENFEMMEFVSKIFRVDEDGDTQLHMAIIHKRVHRCLSFISLAPSPHWLDIRNNLSQTVLHLAVITRQVDIVRRLMVGGADINVMDCRGNTPLHIACRNGYTEIALTLLQPVRYEELSQNQYDISYQKIPQDLNVKNYDGQTCLHLATENSDLDTIRILVNKGADINAKDGKSGRTSLHYTAESGNVPLVELLLTFPCLDINTKTFDGETPLTVAAGRYSVEIVNILLSHGARWPTRDQDGDIEDDDMDGSWTDR